MLESFNTKNSFEYQKLTEEEQTKRGILGRLVGPIADSVNPTRNGRRYSGELWEKVFKNPIMQEKIENRVCFGELGHPADRTETDMEKICWCLAEVPKKGDDGQLYGVFDILPTPNGRILKALCDYGSNIGTSSRGSGDTFMDYDGQESVDPDTYECECWDAVLLPAVKSARLTPVTESLHKTLKESLKTLVNSENEEHQKIMLESLDTIGIKLNESSNSSTVCLTTGELGELPDGFVLTDNGFLDIEKKLSENQRVYGTWVGFEHKGRGDSNKRRKLVGVAYDEVLPAMARYLNVPEESIQVEDMINTTDMVRLSVVVDTGKPLKTNENLNIDYNTESVDDNRANEGEETAADDDGAVVESLQVAVKQKQELENKVLDLQEKLSVSYAKETRLEEQIVKYSKAISNLSTTAKQVSALQEKVNSLTEDLNKEKEYSQQLNGKISKFENISRKEKGLKESLKEKVSDKDVEIRKLNESIKQISEAKTSMQNDNVKLLEQISTLKKDAKMKKTEYSQKLEQANKLVEKYKKVANKAVERYIESQADKIGVSVKEIKNKLPESYTFNDIDSICEDLQSYRLTLSKLPFSTAKNNLNESVKINVTPSKNESIMPGETFNADDEIDEMLKSLL